MSQHSPFSSFTHHCFVYNAFTVEMCIHSTTYKHNIQKIIIKPVPPPLSVRSRLDELFPLFLSNLEDSIPSVRQGAAAALASVTKAYGEDLGL